MTAKQQSVKVYLYRHIENPQNSSDFASVKVQKQFMDVCNFGLTFTDAYVILLLSQENKRRV